MLDTFGMNLLWASTVFHVKEPPSCKVPRRASLFGQPADVGRGHDGHEGRVASGKVFALGVRLAVGTTAEFWGWKNDREILKEFRLLLWKINNCLHPELSIQFIAWKVGEWSKSCYSIWPRAYTHLLLDAVDWILASKSCGLVVEHLAYGRKVVGLIPVNARWKWCQSHARIDFCTQCWFIIENKKNTGSQMGHTKKIKK